MDTSKEALMFMEPSTSETLLALCMFTLSSFFLLKILIFNDSYVSGDYKLESGSTYNLELASATSYDTAYVGGNVVLNGALNVCCFFYFVLC